MPDMPHTLKTRPITTWPGTRTHPHPDEDIATAMIDAHHSAYVHAGAKTGDPTLVAGYDASEPDPGTLLMAVDRDGWATLHRVEARERATGRIQFGPRLPWPDGSTNARNIRSAWPEWADA